MSTTTVLLLGLAIALFVLIFTQLKSIKPIDGSNSRYGTLLRSYINYVLTIAAMCVLTFLLEESGLVVEDPAPGKLWGWFGGISVASFISLIFLVPIAFIGKLFNVQAAHKEIKGPQYIGVFLIDAGILGSLLLVGGAVAS